jgi:hypothetical protein
MHESMAPSILSYGIALFEIAFSSHGVMGQQEAGENSRTERSSDVK